MNETITALITWTTYGTWLPGDKRGWRKRKSGHQLAKPLLEEWARRQMKGQAVLLKPHDREVVIKACQKHCDHRSWNLLAVDARSNHVHVVVEAIETAQKVRDQLKANCTRELRQQEIPLQVERTWTKGGDCQILDAQDDIEAAVLYVTEAQDQKGRDQLPAEHAERVKEQDNIS